MCSYIYKQVDRKLSRRHIGHDEFIVNQRAIHFEWYSCWHGSTRICCPFLKCDIQITQAVCLDDNVVEIL